MVFTVYYELLRCAYGDITRFVELSRVTTTIYGHFKDRF